MCPAGKRLRVLHILEATLGGTRRYLENIAEAVPVDAIQSGLVYSTERCDEQFLRFLGYARKAGWYLNEVPMCRAINPVRDLWSIQRILKILDVFKPDIVHCHSGKAGGLGRLAVLLQRGRRPKVAYTPNALPSHLGWRYTALELLLARFTDHFIAVSASEKREIVRLCRTDPMRVSVVWPVVDGKYFTPVDKGEARRAIGVADEARLIVGVGRLSWQKDPITFVKVVSRLGDVFPDVYGIWVGDGELRSQVDGVIKEEGLSKKLFVTGWKCDVRPFIGAADVVLMPSRYESFGYVAAESMAMGIPVVGTRVTGLVDVIGNSDLLFEPGDWLTASKIVELLIRLPERARSIGEAGRKSVMERFSPSAMARNLAETYWRLV